MNGTVSHSTPAVDAMRTRAALIRTLMQGTAAMRAAGERYAPKYPAEVKEAYQARIARSTLFNATSKTVADFVGRVFRSPIVLGDDVPKEIVEYAENIDLAGCHINEFARAAFADAMQSGIGYILADAPIRPEGLRQTVEAERAAGLRPYLVYVPIERLIGWRSAMVNNVETLTQVRIKECVVEPDGPWGEKEIDQVRVLEPGRWWTYRRKMQQSEEWIEHESGTTSLTHIPLAPIYLKRTGFMTGEPPLSDLAELNAAHWASSSDQRNILTVARCPLLFGAGFTSDDQVVIGASTMIRTSDAAAKLTYVEHSGAAIGAGRQDLQDLEHQMQAMGLQLLVPNPGQTATGEIRDNAKERSALDAMAGALQDALEQAFGFLAEFAGLGQDKGGSLTVNRDFGIVGGADATTLLAAVNSGQISRQTFLNELRRRSILSEDLDFEAELARLEAEDGRRAIDLN